MAFSVSFAFKAVDQYTKVMKNITKATEAQAKAIESLNKALKANRDGITNSAKGMSSLAGSFTKSTQGINNYTKALNGATAATIKQQTAAKSLGNIINGGSKSKKPNYYLGDENFNSRARMKTANRLSMMNTYSGLSSSRERAWSAQMSAYARGEGFKGLPKTKYAIDDAYTNSRARMRSANRISQMNTYSGLSSNQERAWSAQLSGYARGMGFNGLPRTRYIMDDALTNSRARQRSANRISMMNTYSGLSSSQERLWSAQLSGYERGQGFKGLPKTKYIMDDAVTNSRARMRSANRISQMNTFSGLSSSQERAWSAQMARYKNGVFAGPQPKAPKVPKPPKPKRIPTFFGKYGASRDLDMAGFAFGEVGAAILAPFAMGAKAVVDFDTSFAGVKKLLAGSSSPQQIEQIRQDALNLAKVYPMAMEGITAIMGSAASGGIEAKDLKRFSSVAIEASGAFDMSADNTVNAMLAAKAGGKMSNAQLFHYMNATNMLDNLSNARGRDILTQTGNVMGSANNVHMKATDAAAWMTTLIQNHIGTPDAQDTTFTNMMKLGSPSTMSKPAKEALIALYTNNKGIKNDKQGRNILNGIRDNMARDPNGTLYDFLDRIHKQKHPQDFLGKMMRNGLPMQGVMALSQSLPEVKKNMKIANGQVDGSLTREYLAKMDTYAAIMKLINNRFYTFSNIVGDALNKNNLLKNTFRALANQLNDVLSAIEELVKNHPYWTTAIVATTVAVGALIVGLALLSFTIAGANKIWMAWSFIVEAVKVGMATLGVEFTLAEIAVGATTGAVTLFEAAILLLSTPIGLVTLALGALYLVCPPFRDFCNDFVSNAGALFYNWFLEAKLKVEDLTNALNQFKVAGQGVGNWIGQMAGNVPIVGGLSWNDFQNVGAGMGLAGDQFKRNKAGLDVRNKQLEGHFDRAGKGVNFVNAVDSKTRASNPALSKALTAFSNPIRLDIKIDSPVPVTAKSSSKNARVTTSNTGTQMQTGSARK